MIEQAERTGTFRRVALFDYKGRAADRSDVSRTVREGTLLLLDNCEHVLAATATLVHSLLTRCPAVQVLVDGFGSRLALARLRRGLAVEGLSFDVFRPLERWSAWLQPAQLRRLHHKLCVVDDEVAFVGGINILDDRNDLIHGRSDQPRLDFAVALRGPVVAQVRQLAQALGTRVRLGHEWRSEVGALARSPRPVADTLQLLRELRTAAAPAAPAPDALQPVQVAFVVRDNLKRRRAIERSYIEAVRRARHSVDIACPYFYPRRAFRRSLQAAAQRGVQVRLLTQGKVDYRLAALAARVLYDELLARGVRIYEYTPAFLHAKVAVVDDDWATVGSSNIDPLSLLLNLEANVVVRDPDFSASLAATAALSKAASRALLDAICALGVIASPRRLLAEEDGSRTHQKPSDGPTRI